MRTVLRYIAQALLFVLLTILTQIGGVIYLLSIFLARFWNKKFFGKTVAIFTLLYLLSSLWLIPLVAPYFGRQKIEQTESLKPANPISVLLNRDYVSPKLHVILEGLSANQPITFLDANFPFFDGFPLLPHLSHNDGSKIDLAFIYEDSKGVPQNRIKSVSGYGVFEAPQSTEFNQIKKCLEAGYFQYDYPKYLSFGKCNEELVFSKQYTKKLLLNILRQESVEKVFVEPHLLTRMGLSHAKLRYHGCRAVRHDDHIHFQVK